MRFHKSYNPQIYIYTFAQPVNLFLNEHISWDATQTKGADLQYVSQDLHYVSHDKMMQ